MPNNKNNCKTRCDAEIKNFCDYAKYKIEGDFEIMFNQIAPDLEELRQKAEILIDKYPATKYPDTKNLVLVEAALKWLAQDTRMIVMHLADVLGTSVSEYAEKLAKEEEERRQQLADEHEIPF